MWLKGIQEKKQLQNLFIYGFGQGFNLVTPLLVAPFIIAVCGEENFGKTGVALAISFFLIVSVDYGCDIAGVRELSVNRDNKQKVSNLISTIYIARGLLLCFVLLILAILCFTIPFFSSDRELFFLSMPILVGQFINPSWILQGLEDFKMISIYNILSKIIYVAGVFSSVENQADYIYINFWWGAGMIVSGLVMLIYLKRMYSIVYNNTSIKAVKEYLAGNFSLFTSQLLVSLQQYAPIVLVRFIGGDIMAGRYRIIEQIIGVFRTYIMMFFSFVYPKVCYLLETDRVKAMRFWRLYNGGNLLFIAVAMCGLYFLAGPVVRYFNPEEPEVIIRLLQFGVLIPLALAVSNPLKQLVLGNNLQKVYVRIILLLVPVTLLLISLSMPLAGLLGVLASLAVTEIVSAVCFVAAIKKAGAN